MSQQTAMDKIEKRNTGTQTHKNDAMLEIARLQEQVKLLKIENEHLRKYTIENPSIIRKSVTPKTSPNNIIGTPKLNEAKQKNLEVRSTQKINGKGCTCKGKCASKMCGCVKRNSQCGEWCKCSNSICQNQESEDVDQNKENKDYNEVAHKNMKEQSIVNKHLTDVNAQKSVFSPDTTVKNSAFNLEEFRPPSLYFNGPKKLSFGSDEEEKQENVGGKHQKKSTRSIKNDQKPVTQRKGRPRKSNKLEANNTEYVRKLRSTSNEEKQRQNDLEEENHVLRCTSSENQINEEFKQIDKQTGNHFENIKIGMAFLKRGQKGAKSKAKKRTSNGDFYSKEETSPVSGEDNAAKKQEITSNQNSKPSGEGKEDFDPMKPKYELPRTPVHGNEESMSRNISRDISFSVSINTTREEESQTPPELAQAQVNWEEYQAQLVACDKCKRKFHPLRINKHKSCCKKL